MESFFRFPKEYSSIVLGLNDLINNYALENSKKMLNKVVPVLILGESDKENKYIPMSILTNVCTAANRGNINFQVCNCSSICCKW